MPLLPRPSLLLLPLALFLMAGCFNRATIATEPAGAAIVVDGQAAGTTPAKVALAKPGSSVRLALAGYHPWERRVTPAEAKTVFAAPVRLEKIVPGVVKLESQPSGAEVFLDNELLGTTPLSTMPLQPGTYEFMFILNDYGQSRLKATVDGRTPQQELSVTLQSRKELYFRKQIELDPANCSYRADLLHELMIERRFDDAIKAMEETVRAMGKKTAMSNPDKFWREMDSLWSHQYVWGTQKEIVEMRKRIAQAFAAVIKEFPEINGEVRQRSARYNESL